MLKVFGCPTSHFIDKGKTEPESKNVIKQFTQEEDWMLNGGLNSFHIILIKLSNSQRLSILVHSNS